MKAPRGKITVFKSPEEKQAWEAAHDAQEAKLSELMRESHDALVKIYNSLPLKASIPKDSYAAGSAIHSFADHILGIRATPYVGSKEEPVASDYTGAHSVIDDIYSAVDLHFLERETGIDVQQIQYCLAISGVVVDCLSRSAPNKRKRGAKKKLVDERIAVACAKHYYFLTGKKPSAMSGENNRYAGDSRFTTFLGEVYRVLGLDKASPRSQGTVVAKRFDKLDKEFP